MEIAGRIFTCRTSCTQLPSIVWLATLTLVTDRFRAFLASAGCPEGYLLLPCQRLSASALPVCAITSRMYRSNRRWLLAGRYSGWVQALLWIFTTVHHPSRRGWTCPRILDRVSAFHAAATNESIL